MGNKHDPPFSLIMKVTEKKAVVCHRSGALKRKGLMTARSSGKSKQPAVKETRSLMKGGH